MSSPASSSSLFGSSPPPSPSPDPLFSDDAVPVASLSPPSISGLTLLPFRLPETFSSSLLRSAGQAGLFSAGDQSMLFFGSGQPAPFLASFIEALGEWSKPQMDEDLWSRAFSSFEKDGTTPRRRQCIWNRYRPGVSSLRLGSLGCVSPWPHSNLVCLFFIRKASAHT